MKKRISLSIIIFLVVGFIFIYPKIDSYYNETKLYAVDTTSYKLKGGKRSPNPLKKEVTILLRNEGHRLDIVRYDGDVIEVNLTPYEASRLNRIKLLKDNELTLEERPPLSPHYDMTPEKPIL